MYVLLALVASATAVRMHNHYPAHQSLLHVGNPGDAIIKALRAAAPEEETAETNDLVKWLSQLSNPNDGLTWTDVTSKLNEQAEEKGIRLSFAYLKKMRKTFTDIDTNKNGICTVQEMKEYLSR